MSTFTTIFNPIASVAFAAYSLLASMFVRLHAHLRKQRSLHQLERLDDYLLNDIGLKRENNEIMPLRDAPITRTRLYSVQESQLRTRARSYKRERQRHSRRRTA